MKFGGSSLSNAANIQRVLSIIEKQRAQSAVAVVLSAAGQTTDRLVSMLECAQRSDISAAVGIQRELQEFHLDLAETLLSRRDLDRVDRTIRTVFRDMHVQLLDLAEEGRPATPELSDEILSAGERLSSLLVAFALENAGVGAQHFDSRKLIVTDDQFTNAKPLIWETYAKIRWALPHALNHAVAVAGGFIGSTADGRTTTLGRGGSDLTAALFGAAMNASSIQIWKDVDGFLTCDPRMRCGGFRLKNLSYREAEELARAGARILHPESIAPAKRLRIPVIIRNSFRPAVEGTTIGMQPATSSNPVKSITYRKDVTVLELSSVDAEPISSERILAQLENWRKEKIDGEILGRTGARVYLGLYGGIKDYASNFRFGQCCACRVHSEQAILTLVGEALIGNNQVDQKLRLAFGGDRKALLLPRDLEACSIRLAVPVAKVCDYLNLFHDELFREVDPRLFVSSEKSVKERVRAQAPDVRPRVAPKGRVAGGRRLVYS
jgi:aspartate kinase